MINFGYACAMIGEFFKLRIYQLEENKSSFQ